MERGSLPNRLRIGRFEVQLVSRNELRDKSRPNKPKSIDGSAAIKFVCVGADVLRSLWWFVRVAALFVGPAYGPGVHAVVDLLV